MIDTLKENRLIRKGKKLLTKGKLEKAYRCFEKAVMLNNSINNRFYLGLSMMSLTRFADAKKIFTDIRKEDEENELNLLSLAECNMMLRKWLEAENIYRKLHKMFPNNEAYKEYLERSQDVIYREKYVIARELFSKAERALFAKDKKEALKHLLEAEEYNPNSSMILNNIASLYMLLKKYEEAYPYIERAITISPDNQRFQKNYISIKRKLRK